MEIEEEHVVSLMVAVSSALFREGIRKIIKCKKDIEIIAEASTHQDIIPLVEKKKPDVLFIDTAIPDLDILKILESIKEKSAQTKVLLLLHTIDERFVINAISLGARGCLKDSSNAGQFIQAIRSISDDEIWVQRKIITKILAQFLYSEKGKPKPLQLNLTKREEEITKLVIRGYSNKQIATKLSISEKTVKNHLANIFKKLGITKRLQLTIFYLGGNFSKLSPRIKAPENFNKS